MKMFLIGMLLLAQLEAALTWQESIPGGFTTSVHISNDKISFEEPLYIDLSLTYPAGYTVDQAKLRSNLLRNATPDASPFLLTQEKAVSLDTGLTLHYKLEPQIPGDFTLSFYDIVFSSEKNNAVVFSPLFRTSVFPSPSQPFMEEPAPFLTLSRDVPVDLTMENRRLLKKRSTAEPERNLKIQNDRSFPWGLLGTFFLASLIYIWVRFFRKPSRPSPESQALSARGKALHALQRIKAERPSFSKELNELSNTVRVYVEDRYGIQAPQKTTQEFLELMPSAVELPPDFPKQQLLQFLQFSDKVKFAKTKPSQEEREQAWEAAAGFINS